MPDVKLVVIYPRPKDVDAFEKIYQNESQNWAARPRLLQRRSWVPHKGSLLSTALRRFTFHR
jgi:hypothetical protein